MRASSRISELIPKQTAIIVACWNQFDIREQRLTNSVSFLKSRGQQVRHSLVYD
jgi:hypothetical protein